MTQKHTPGPWEQIKQRAPNGGTYWDITEHSRQAHDRIAMCGPWTASRCGTEAAANARLIAAAPDLLASLQEIADAGESAANSYPGDGWRLAHEKFAAFARAAISKATGE